MMSAKRFAMLFLVCALVLAVFAGVCSAADFSKDDLRRMGTFLSNFTELGYMDFDAKEFTSEDPPVKIVRFGIWHNYINNYKSRIAQCKVKNCEWGSLVIDGKYVKESVKKYFAHDMKKLPSIKNSDMSYHYDGKLYHFEGADGEAVYYARVKKASKNGAGQIIMTGELYNTNDTSDILGTFEAVTKPYKYGGKNTWSIISMKTKHGE